MKMRKTEKRRKKDDEKDGDKNKGIKREKGRRNKFEIVLDTGSRHVRPLPCTIIHLTWCDSLVHESRN